MRIVLVNKYWYEKGGAERVLFLTKALLEAAGHEVAVFGMHHENNIVENEYFVAPVDYTSLSIGEKIRAGMNAIYNVDAKKKFRALVEQFQPDVVHIHNIYHQLSYSLLDVTSKKQIPVVMTMHDYNMHGPNYRLFHHGHVCDAAASGTYYRCLLHNCMENWGESVVATIAAYVGTWRGYREKIAAYIAPTEFVRQKSIDYGWDSARVVTIPYAVDASAFTPLETSADGRMVTYLGRLSEEKGLEVFLEAAMLNAELPHIIIGEGPLRPMLEHTIAKKKMRNVQLVGFQSGEALRTYLADTRLLVVPSTWYEVTGLTILEGKLMEKIVIGSSIGAIPESLPESCLVPPRDAHALAITVAEWYDASQKERQRLGTVFRQEVIIKHDPKQYYDRLLDVYESVQK